jgi:hypothetical protein
MKLQAKGLLAAFLAALALTALDAAPASAAFGLKDLGFSLSEGDGTPATQAGSHPFELVQTLGVNTTTVPVFGEVPDEQTKDLSIELPAGMAGFPKAVPTCSTADFIHVSTAGTACQDASAIGLVDLKLGFGFAPPTFDRVPIYNLAPPVGVAAKIGFKPLQAPVTAQIGLNPDPPYNLIGTQRNIPQVLRFYSATLHVWGNPLSPVHDSERGRCAISGGSCPVALKETPFLVSPRSCTGPLAVSFKADSWENPGAWVRERIESEPGMGGCSNLAFAPRIDSRATTESAESGTGLDFDVDFHDEGLTSPEGIAQSDVKKAVVTLPKGMTINPSVGEGLGVCTPAQLGRETVGSFPGEGCPNSSKIGTLNVETPLVDEAVDGSIFLAQQDDASTTTPGAENPFDSVIALYFVLKNPTLGAILKLPVEVEPDPNTGQLVATLDDVPQLPFSHFNATLRTGARAALVTPSACGTHTTKAQFTPWANPTAPLTTTASFQVTSGIGGGPCPPGGVPPFHPAFEAGALNNNAGSFSPFNMRLIRADGEQDMTKFSSILPPGELGSLAGVSKCPDAAIDIAKSKTGRQELSSPSCPANSLIGRTLAGAGVGGALTYVGGQLYLGGPYKGDPLSVISVTPAAAGPFDAGTVVVRLALTLNPKTAEVEVDGANSDPIPHILKGIVLKVRDLRVYVDRPNFTLNPTSCDESSTDATLFGSYLDVFNPADDVPVVLSARYQAANCVNLGFKPKLALNLKGGAKRGGHPGLTATYTPRKGDANVKGLVVRLPRSAFLDQAHIRTICTRVQFAADACPKGAQYGFIKAWTPLLDEPLQGPVYLRSSSHKLPDLVFDLHGLVDVEVATRIDSVKGGIRATVEDAPDAPLSKVVVQMQGAKKGLIVNSRNLCGAVSKANVEFTGHNGKQFTSKSVMRPDCGGGRKGKRAARGQS